ncbi:helix-turn-helix domain-containing protein [Antarctobacter heliothermus]|uniref:helix-turn-helix domain-containing protein n=1 Tax=Antarctobacter heliothermus TaxID=74033 RepID=UPI0012FD66E8
MTLSGKASLSISEIADRLGYSEASRFDRAFRRCYGKAPNAKRWSCSPDGG